MRRSKRWFAVLLGAACPAFALLAFALWRLAEQETMLEAVRLRERLDNAASLVVRESERALDQAAADNRASLTLQWDHRGLRRTAGVPLPWSPAPHRPADAPAHLFARGEQLEIAGAQPAQAITLYRELLTHPDPAVRAGALLRIARCERTAHRPADALKTYQSLAALGPASVAGASAELVARRERAALLDAPAAAREREQLQALLENGTGDLDRPTFEFYAQGLPVNPAATAWAEAAAALWRHAAQQPAGQEILPIGDRLFVARWTHNGPQGAGQIVAFDSVRHRLTQALAASPVLWRLQTAGRDLAGPSGLQGPALSRKGRETGLPWEVTVALPPGVETSRGTLLIAVLVVLGLAILATLHLAYRAVRRELRIAEMQSEFVAAVSHEFRTPITALTHLTDLLVSGDAPPGRRQLYYNALALETGRLREMVENLLDFGRIEAGQYKYKPEDVVVEDFVRGIVDEFQVQPSATVRAIGFQSDAAGETASVDREAMRRAVWNLLDNAVKYTPPESQITTHVASSPGWTMVSVQDQGPGIAKEDRERIFQKFVRGGAEGRQRVKGTGIGLAIVQAIAQAHGGRVELRSEPGAGSRFTILLPAERKQAWPIS